MRLTLRLTERGGDTDQTRVLETGRLTIGRGMDNDWVLADPDRTLSKQHCRIDASDEAYMLTDLSTNGVFLSGSAQPLGRGHSCALEHGDSFTIGPYRLLADIEGHDYAQGLSMPAGEDEPPPPAPSLSPITPAIEAPWLTDIPTGGFGPNRRTAPLGWDAPPDPASFAASGVLQSRDPLDPRSGGGYVPASDMFSQEAEHIPAASTVMRLPQAQIVLPVDWNETDTRAPQAAPSAPAAAAWPPPLPDEPEPVAATLPADWIAEEPEHPHEAFSPPVSTPALPDDWAPGPMEAPPPPAPPPPPASAPSLVPPSAPALSPSWSTPEPPPAAAWSPPGPAPRPRPAAAVMPAPVPPPAPVFDEPVEQMPAAAASPSSVMAAFLEGAGLPANILAEADLTEAFRDIGMMVRAAVDGVRDILSTRALVKSEFRVEQTVLRRSDNNAMKFAPDAQRCLAAMVGASPPGFLPGSAAMRQSMDDIKMHELALVAAINSVFADLSQRLDPETIMTRAKQETGLTTMLPYAREVRCWAIYSETHALLQDSGAHNTGGSLLAPVAQAYARQLRRS